MNKKNIIYGVGAVALLGVVYYAMKKKKDSVSTIDMATTMVEVAPYSIQWKDDPTGGVYIVENGKKYAFISEKAFVNYGYSVPKLVTKEELDAIPSSGFVDESGKVIKN
jgi:hypothetical protein